MASEPDSERALAIRPEEPPPRLRLADSLADRRAGEIVLLDGRGEVVSRRRLRRLQVLNLAVLAVIIALGSAAFGAPAAVGGVVGGLIGAGLRRRRWGKIRRAAALIATWRNDEARVLLTQVAASRARKLVRMSAERMLAIVAWRRGAHQEALGHVERAHALSPVRQRLAVGGHLLAVTRVEVLIELDLDRAAKAAAELERLPATEFFHAERRYIKLSLAFHRDRPEELPDDLELHEWARADLGNNDAGWRLGLLAWAFDRRGDREMAELLLGEVESHLPVPLARLQPMTPKLHAWLAPRIAALPPDED